MCEVSGPVPVLVSALIPALVPNSDTGPVSDTNPVSDTDSQFQAEAQLQTQAHLNVHSQAYSMPMYRSKFKSKIRRNLQTSPAKC